MTVSPGMPSKCLRLCVTSGMPWRIATAATQGVTFEVDFMREINETFAPSHNIASMLQDLRRGQRLQRRPP